jgi:PAS domain S-box-containing protein
MNGQSNTFERRAAVLALAASAALVACLHWDVSADLLLPIALLGCAGLAGWGWWQRRRAEQLQECIQARLVAAAQPGQAELLRDPVKALDVLVVSAEQQLRREREARQRAETELHDSQERYALAVRGATDGLWEWNFATRAAYFSPRAKAMLGYGDDEIGHGVKEWRSRIHPDDLREALVQLDAYLQGRRQSFEVEHRMRHRDGSWRWVLARAALVRHASGKPERLIGLYSDITPRKRVQQVLIDLADGLAGLQGEACLQALVQRFAQALGVREAFVCECIDYPTTRVRMLARWKGDELARCVEFDLTGTACEHVIGYGKEVFVPAGAGQRWPAEALFDRDSYLGLPCLDSRGSVIGHVACADPGGMPEELPHRAVLRLFALRASLELERRQLAREQHRLSPALPQHAPAMLH